MDLTRRLKQTAGDAVQCDGELSVLQAAIVSNGLGHIPGLPYDGIDIHAHSLNHTHVLSLSFSLSLSLLTHLLYFHLQFKKHFFLTSSLHKLTTMALIPFTTLQRMAIHWQCTTLLGLEWTRCVGECDCV